MNSNFSISKEGKLIPLSPPQMLKKAQHPPPSENALDHVLSYAIDSDHSLLIDSFHNVLEITDAQTAKHLLNSPDKLSSPLKQYYQAQFTRDLNSFQQRYTESLQQKEKRLIFFICPTYSCNMHCSYCYQQGSKTLNREMISPENLQHLFAWITQKIVEWRKNDPLKPVGIALFGGEPLQKTSKDVVKEIFAFARAQNAFITITTNGMELQHFLDLLITYRGYIASIATTIDGSKEMHDKRRGKTNPTNSFCGTIIDIINTLLQIGIHVSVGINLDYSNICDLQNFLDICSENKWVDNSLVTLEIGRVDDRCYNLNNEQIMSEAALIEALINCNAKKKFPSNIKAAFMKTSMALASQFGFLFNQNEYGRGWLHYCWSSSPIDEVYYLDSELDVYRCTYSVGNKEFVLGTIHDSHTLSSWFTHNAFQKECWDCPLGGYCSGGCVLSAQKNQKRQCRYELENFDYLINTSIIPLIRKKLSEAQLPLNKKEAQYV